MPSTEDTPCTVSPTAATQTYPHHKINYSAHIVITVYHTFYEIATFYSKKTAILLDYGRKVYVLLSIFSDTGTAIAANRKFPVIHAGFRHADCLEKINKILYERTL